MAVAPSPEDFPVAAPTSTEFSLGREFVGGHAARTRSGDAALLLPVAACAKASAATHGHLRVRVLPALDVTLSGDAKRVSAVSLECLDESLLPTFCILCADVLSRLSRPATPKHISTIVREWRDLLRPIGRMTPEAELGLWGELHLILASADAAAAVEAWHGPEAAAIDFARGGVALECKATHDHHRHYVSLDQVSWGDGEYATYMVSMVVEHDAATGRTVPELVAHVSAALDDGHELFKRLRRVGYAPEHASEYQQRLVVADTWFIPMTCVPRVHAVDPGVSNVRFEVDCSTVAQHRLDPAGVADVLSRLTRHAIHPAEPSE